MNEPLIKFKTRYGDFIPKPVVDEYGMVGYTQCEDGSVWAWAYCPLLMSKSGEDYEKR